MMQQNYINTIQQRLLLVTCVVLACVLVIQLSSTRTSIDGSTDTEKSTVVTAMNTEPVQLHPIEQYNEITTRPLFAPDRKPYVPIPSQTETKKLQVKKNTPVTKLPNQLLLTGIVISPELQLAILQSGKTKSLQRVKLGESIDGWTLDEIHNRYVILKNGAHTHTLELEVKGSTSTAHPKQVTKAGESSEKNWTITHEADNETAEGSQKTETTTNPTVK